MKLTLDGLASPGCWLQVSQMLVRISSYIALVGLPNTLVDEMLGSPRLLAVRLAPSVGQSRFYATPQEFCMVWILLLMLDIYLDILGGGLSIL